MASQSDPLTGKYLLQMSDCVRPPRIGNFTNWKRIQKIDNDWWLKMFILWFSEGNSGFAFIANSLAHFLTKEMPHQISRVNLLRNKCSESLFMVWDSLICASKVSQTCDCRLLHSIVTLKPALLDFHFARGRSLWNLLESVFGGSTWWTRIVILLSCEETNVKMSKAT